jgi:hypothetical protein
MDIFSIPFEHVMSSRYQINSYEKLSNHSCSKNSFYLPVTAWVYGKKVQLEALVDSGATTTFINKRLVKSNNLLTHKLASLFNVINADGTSNKSEQITDAIRCYLEIETHKSKNQILVTDLGSKDMILGMSFLQCHNPEIDWAGGEWKFSMCPETCANEPRKKQHNYVSHEELEELEILQDGPWEQTLDKIGESDSKNPQINWIDKDDPDELRLAEVIAAMSEKDIERDDDNTGDSVNWRPLVTKELWDYRDVFSKRKSERMPTRKPYDHSIDFEKDAVLPKPAKLYPMSSLEKNSLDK